MFTSDDREQILLYTENVRRQVAETRQTVKDAFERSREAQQNAAVAVHKARATLDALTTIRRRFTERVV